MRTPPIVSGLALAAGALLAFAHGQETPTAPGAGLDNPVAYTKASIARGRKHYLRYCQTCHGFDGRALENVDFEAADLTRPAGWRFGTSDRDLFRNTKDGAGDDMPPFAKRLNDRAIWDLVNYLRSLGPEEYQRPLAPDAADATEAEEEVESPSQGAEPEDPGPERGAR